jgi:hypothetical protein
MLSRSSNTNLSSEKTITYTYTSNSHFYSSYTSDSQSKERFA